MDEYKELCREHAPKSDKWRYGMASKMFGFHGQQNERAYQDAIRDIGAWVMGLPAADPRPRDRRRRRRRLRPRERRPA